MDKQKSKRVDEILGELNNYVAGRGSDINFCYSKRYSPKSFIRCVDFSSWINEKIIENDICALAVLRTQLRINLGIGAPATFRKIDVWADEVRIKNILNFPFNDYFYGDFESAKNDILTARILTYPGIQFCKILVPYDISLKNIEVYVERYNEYLKRFTKYKRTPIEIPDNLPADTRFLEFQQELRKLPLATRLHLFDILKYQGFSKKGRFLRDMTLFDTRFVGIDECESANILQQSKLINISSDGTGSINPDYFDAVSVALNYTEKIGSAFREWFSEVADIIMYKDIEGVIYLGYVKLGDDDHIYKW